MVTVAGICAVLLQNAQSLQLSALKCFEKPLMYMPRVDAILTLSNESR